MVILGIDPGIATVGYAIIKKEADRLRCVTFGCITTPAGLDVSLRLSDIVKNINLLITKYRPACAAIEQLFFAKNTKTALLVAHARGAILAALAARGVQISEYTPLQVKQALTGYGKAEKLQIQKMVQLLLAIPSLPKPDDAADALAVAISCAHSNHGTIH